MYNMCWYYVILCVPVFVYWRAVSSFALLNMCFCLPAIESLLSLFCSERERFVGVSFLFQSVSLATPRKLQTCAVSALLCVLPFWFLRQTRGLDCQLILWTLNIFFFS